uniref:Uncharacterized protein n=1 Tax=Romanomermis culicivorax TaxID=13658 RepID=A0A915KJJ2_ROMCU
MSPPSLSQNVNVLLIKYSSTSILTYESKNACCWVETFFELVDDRRVDHSVGFKSAASMTRILTAPKLNREDLFSSALEYQNPTKFSALCDEQLSPVHTSVRRACSKLCSKIPDEQSFEQAARKYLLGEQNPEHKRFARATH